MANWVKLLSTSGGVGIDLDPAYASTIQEGWFYAEVYFPAALLSNISSGSSMGFYVPGGFLCGGDSLHLGIRNNAGTFQWRDTSAAVSYGTVVADTWYVVETHINVGTDVVELKVDGVSLGTYSYAAATTCTASPVGLNALLLRPQTNFFGSSSRYVGVDNLAYSLTGWVSDNQADTVLWTFDGTDPLNDDTATYPDPPFWVNGTTPTAQASDTGGAGPGPGPPETGGEEPPPQPSAVRAASVLIDGVDVSNCVLSGSVTRRLNRPWSATWRMPSDCDAGGTCSRVKIFFHIGGSDVLWFHGFIDAVERQCDEDMCYTEYTATDPMSLWKWRPARSGPDSADPGDFSNPELFFDPSVEGPTILYQTLLQSEDDSDPEFGEGTLFIDLAGAGVATGGPDLSGAPVDYPMTIAEVFELLSSTGTVDAVLTPIDSGGNMASLDIYNGDYGTDRTATVSFDYATGDHNVRALRQNIDSTNVCNKLWYYLGPRVLTALDPGGDQHWHTNITGTDPRLPGMVGGVPTDPPITTVLARRDQSREDCGVRMEVQIFDALNDTEGPAASVELFLRRWIMEQYLRSTPRELVHVQPVRISDNMQLPPGVTPVQVGDFDIGDLVTVSAGAIVGGGFSGAQRVYEYTVSWDEDGVLEMGELQTSADQEGVIGA